MAGVDREGSLIGQREVAKVQAHAKRRRGFGKYGFLRWFRAQKRLKHLYCYQDVISLQNPAPLGPKGYAEGAAGE